MPDVSPWTCNLLRSPGGVWLSNKAAEISYPDEGHEQFFQIEEKSFWFNHRNDCLVRVFHRFPPLGVLFDVGGGNGFVTLTLNRNGFPAVLVEPGIRGARNAKSRGVEEVICSTFQDADFPDRSLPAVGLFDVLEHIEDDHAFLTVLSRKLSPAGRVYLTVPTYSWLWSEEDYHFSHWRRYTRSSLCRILEKQGLHVEYATYFFSFLVVPIFLGRALPYRLGLAPKRTHENELTEHTANDGSVDVVLRPLMKWERKRMGEGSIAFGSSCIAVAKLKS